MTGLCHFPCFFQDGLVHISAIAAGRVEKVSDFLDVGDKVWAKVRRVCHRGSPFSILGTPSCLKVSWKSASEKHHDGWSFFFRSFQAPRW